MTIAYETPEMLQELINWTTESVNAVHCRVVNSWFVMPKLKGDTNILDNAADQAQTSLTCPSGDIELHRQFPIHCS
jgi:hypothetical protein